MLGDLIETALKRVGITQESVERFVGGPCGCKERRDKLNALDAWARRILKGRIDRAREYLFKLTGVNEDEQSITDSGDHR